MKKNLAFILALVMLVGLFTGIVTAAREQTQVFAFSGESTTGGPYGSWTSGDNVSNNSYLVLDASTGYAAECFWTGKTDGNFNVVLGEGYVLSFKVKGVAGEKVQYDFKDGSVGMGGEYTIQETGVWETVTSEAMTANVTYEDIPETDPNYGNGVSARIYSIGADAYADVFYIENIAIFELGEEIVEPEPELPEEPEVEAPEKCIWLQGNRNEDRPGNYAAIYQWTGKDADDNYNIEAGKQYIMEFDVKGNAGESIMFDFSDGQVPSAKGSYVFQSNNWEHVESPILTMDKPYEDFAPGDGNIINGYCYRIYTIADTADTVFADRFYVDNVVIYEVDENGEKGEEAFSWDWNIDPTQYPAVLGAGGALEAMNSWATSFGDIIVDVPEDEIVDPEEPGQDPEDPEEPGEDPEEPGEDPEEDPEDEPVEDDEPIEEDEPVEDEEVEEEEEEEEEKEEDKKEEAPKTADNMSVFAVVALMLASVVGVVVAKKSVLSK